MSTAQRKALTNHRHRQQGRGVIRVEVQVPAADAPILRDLAAILRGGAAEAQALRDRLRSAITRAKTASVFEIFGSDLPDSYFDGVLDQERLGGIPREIEL